MCVRKGETAAATRMRAVVTAPSRGTRFIKKKKKKNKKQYKKLYFFRTVVTRKCSAHGALMRCVARGHDYKCKYLVEIIVTKRHIHYLITRSRVLARRR